MDLNWKAQRCSGRSLYFSDEGQRSSLSANSLTADFLLSHHDVRGEVTVGQGISGPNGFAAQLDLHDLPALVVHEEIFRSRPKQSPLDLGPVIVIKAQHFANDRGLNRMIARFVNCPLQLHPPSIAGRPGHSREERDRLIAFNGAPGYWLAEACDHQAGKEYNASRGPGPSGLLWQ